MTEPRLRGDGPSTYFCYSDYLDRTPPTRGWTHREKTLTPAPLQNPAYAGMDLLGWVPFHYRGPEPRLRGDGPR